MATTVRRWKRSRLKWPSLTCRRRSCVLDETIRTLPGRSCWSIPIASSAWAIERISSCCRCNVSSPTCSRKRVPNWEWEETSLPWACITAKAPCRVTKGSLAGDDPPSAAQLTLMYKPGGAAPWLWRKRENVLFPTPTSPCNNTGTEVGATRISLLRSSCMASDPPKSTESGGKSPRT